MFTATESAEFFVTDLSPGREFYGGALQLPVISESAGRIVFYIPDSRLALTLDEKGAPPLLKTEIAPANSFRLTLLVEDVDSAVFHLHRHGARFVSQVIESGGLWLCEVLDPYGNRIAIAQLNEIRS